MITISVAVPGFSCENNFDRTDSLGCFVDNSSNFNPESWKESLELNNNLLIEYKESIVTFWLQSKVFYLFFEKKNS